MKALRHKAVAIGGNLAASLSFGFAHAQAPERTTASYSDWTVRCELPAGSSGQKSCEMVQATQIQGQSTPVTQIAVGRMAKAEPMKIVIQVPHNVWLSGGARLVYDKKQSGLEATFTRCLPVGCFAEMNFSDEVLKKLRDRTEPGELEFKDAAQRPVTVPVSFKGFAQAYEALLKELK